MNIKEFECIECGHTFNHDINAKDVWEERICSYGDDLCSCGGLVHHTDCPECKTEDSAEYYWS